MKYSAKELCLIWLDSFLGLEYKHKNEIYKIIEDKSDIKRLLSSAKDYIESKIGVSEYQTLLSSANNGYLEYLLDGLNKRGIIAVTIDSDIYPEKLKDITCPPLVLYCKGKVELLNSESFAIVGSRKSLPSSIGYAKEFAAAIGKAGLTLVTGIAEGVDITVIKEALKSGVPIISVTAGGLDHIYPAANAEIFNEVSKSGLAISEYPPEVVPKPFNFPIRNRIIAGLSKGVLIVSAKIKSGTMYTAEYALDFGRDIFAVPYSPGIESGAGCNELIKRTAILADSPNDILSYYNLNTEEKELHLSEEEQELVSVLKNGSLHIEKIAKLLGKKVYEITPTLSMLEIKGVVIKSGINLFGLTI